MKLKQGNWLRAIGRQALTGHGKQNMGSTLMQSVSLLVHDQGLNIYPVEVQGLSSAVYAPFCCPNARVRMSLNHKKHCAKYL